MITASPAEIRATNIYAEAFRAGLAPQAAITVSQWADEYRYLSQAASAEPGKWDTSRTPYLKEIMDCLSPSNPVKRIVFMKGAQLGGTEAGNNWIGYIIHYNPAPTLMVLPSLDVAKKVSKQRLAPTIAETPVLAERIAPARERDSGNTLLVKEFQGGMLLLTGANSAAGLRSMPIKNLFLDEVDAYPGDVEGEGDPVALAEQRTATFARKKIFLVSTPLVKDLSRIEREYENSDKRKFYVPCPQCGEYQVLKWGGPAVRHGIKWDGDDYSTAHYVCEHNGCVIRESDKTILLERGEWRAENPGVPVAGFHLSSLYSPVGWVSWPEIVKEFLEAKGDPPKLKAWMNTKLGETYEEAYASMVGATTLAERAEPYEINTVPEGGVVLTAGVDVQDNRLVVKVKAWGEGEESWLVAWAEIYGDPAQLEVWNQVDNLLTQDYKHESGARLRIKVAAVDTGGHFTNEAYVFCRARKRRGVIAIKGSSRAAAPAISKPTRQDINWKNQKIKSGVELFLVGVDGIKTTVYSRIKAAKEKGGGAMHFPIGLPVDYYKQLTAEKQVTRFHHGFAKRVWHKKDGTRNEALDCEVYAYAALQYLYTRVNRNTIWLQLKKKLDTVIETVEAHKHNAGTELTPPPPPPKPKTKRPSRGRYGGFVRNW